MAWWSDAAQWQRVLLEWLPKGWLAPAQPLQRCASAQTRPCSGLSPKDQDRRRCACAHLARAGAQ